MDDNHDTVDGYCNHGCSKDFEMTMHSPGMQAVSKSPTSENLHDWLVLQLGRLGIKPADLSGVCTDNASNISKAISLDQDLREGQLFCLCHLINIAVQRATKNPATRLDDIDLTQDAFGASDWAGIISGWRIKVGGLAFGKYQVTPPDSSSEQTGSG